MLQLEVNFFDPAQKQIPAPTSVVERSKFSTLVQEPRFIFEVNLKSFDAIAERRDRSPIV